MLLVTVPVLLPSLVEMNIDLIWFGIYVVILAELALVTPPLGILLFIVHGVAVDSTAGSRVRISVAEAFKGAVWFIIVAVGVLLLILRFPDLVTWLPSLQR
jgi:C4-dicarboxylate transporter, DctM subunit